MDQNRGWIGLAKAVSDVFGWIYFLAWTMSFYPQPILNIKRRSTMGLVVDFPLLNILGFACYTLSTSSFLFNETIRKQYAIRNPSAPIATVRLNDFAFAVHALIMSLIIYSQLFAKLWGFEDIPGKRASRATQGIVWGSLFSLMAVTLLVLSQGQEPENPRAWAAIDVVYAASYVKLLVTCIKYVPQAVSHYQHKSTAGWAIGGMILDLIGGVLSIAQIVIDSSLQHDYSGITGNFAKFGLGNVSIFFDVIFIFQHYFLYRKNNDSGSERVRLLGES